jgi:hypothetical protein
MWMYSMPLKEKLKHIAAELKGHAPFTVFGALLGMLFMLVFKHFGQFRAETLFSIFHPAHVVLSAMVTASIFQLHRKGRNFLLVLVVGYVGSIGIATLSDSIVPYFGEQVFSLNVPSHADVHGHVDEPGEEAESDQGHGLHLGFLEQWYIIHPAAILGVLIAYFLPRTKFPHAGHVLISTWASSSHILMNIESEITAGVLGAIFVILFVAVWLPCCVSDIIFPLLFVESDIELVEICACREHSLHSHPHRHKHSEKCEGQE